ncbi:hypothetical protein [methane-oxidizing endosymbiont of Gigantopelta aegis]|uniref:hypothetical protein n=1 Tax=methane-oxidizing endosymbiont of Gigantopelta aegis TaxID=2794938 RepID=UPI0018DD6B55|nr:hypothetical protein [methane-oxidizing endosymbiont of Gigantopelta aegis]
MESTNWENIIVGILAIGIVFWMWPGVKQTMAQSQQAEKDWPGFLIPLAAVALFIVFLIYMAAN